MRTEIRRGDIFEATLPAIFDHVHHGSRPVLVVGNNMGNKYSPNVLVVPLTSKHKKNMPTHIVLKPNRVNNLEKVSTVLCEQILTISKDNLKSLIGCVRGEDMDMVDDCIRISIGV